MPNIAQQDYIIIDWEGKTDSDATKKAEVDAILKNLYFVNLLSILSVVFKNYGTTLDESFLPIIGVSNSGGDGALIFADIDGAGVFTYDFAIL